MQSKNWKGWIYEHIVLAEKNLGRYLRDDEEVHHLDLNPKNNRLDNLLVLLKSEHARLHKWLETYCNINQKRELKYCPCGQILNFKQREYCSKNCESKYRVTKRPSYEVLKSELKGNINWSALGRKYKVSDNCVRKWVKYYNLTLPSRVEK